MGTMILPYWDYLIASIILLGFVCLISAPITVYCALNLRRDWNRLYVVKRHRLLVLIALVAINLCQLIYVPVYLVLHIIAYSNKSESDGKEYLSFASDVDFYGVNIVLVPCWYLYILVMSFRLWLLYFDMEFTQYNLEKEWLHVIDPSLKTKKETNYFASHQFTTGSSKYLLLRYGIAIIVTCSLISFLFRLSNETVIFSRVMTLIVGFLFVSFSIVIWRIMKRKTDWSDELCIRDELLMIFKFGSVIFIIACVVNVLHFRFDILNENVYNLIWNAIVMVTFSIMTYIHIIVPKNLSKSSNGDDSDILNKLDCCFDQITARIHEFSRSKLNISPASSANNSSQLENEIENDIKSNGSNSDNDDSVGFGKRWQDIVRTPNGYSTLMHHLKREFSETEMS